MSDRRPGPLGLSAALLVASALLAGCTVSSGGPTSTNVPPQGGGMSPGGPGVPNGPGGPGPGPSPGPMDGGMRAPIVLTLNATGQDPATGELSFLAVVDINAPPGFPVTLTALLPPGAQLTGGLPQETLNLPQPGQLQRPFRVRGALTPQSPLRVVIDGRAPDNSSGLHAERLYPPPASAPVRTVGPMPPGGRPPGAVPR